MECDLQVSKLLRLLRDQRFLDNKVCVLYVCVCVIMYVCDLSPQVSTVNMALKSKAAVGAIRYANHMHYHV